MAGYMVLVQDDEGAVIAVGPVYTDEAVDQVRATAERADYEPYGTVSVLTWAAFRSEVRREVARKSAGKVKS